MPSDPLPSVCPHCQHEIPPAPVDPAQMNRRLFDHRRQPLTVKQCADFMSYTTEWIRQAILEGVAVGDGRVFLAAEQLEMNKRRSYRIHEHAFYTFLQAIGWRHLPKRPAAAERAA